MSIYSAIASVLVALSLVGCAEPLQSGGVHMFAGANARLEAMCRFRRNVDGGQGSCVSAAVDVAPATATRISSSAQLVGGPKVAGVVGDVLLTNGQVSAIFGGQSNERPGLLLDLVDAQVGQDELEFVATCVPAQTGCHSSAPPEFGQERDGSAWVEVRLVEPSSFDVRTRYTLLPGARALLVTTTVSVRGSDAKSLSRLDDLVAWGATQPMVPVQQVPGFVAAVGSRVAYAITPVRSMPGVANESPDNGMYVHHAQDVVIGAARAFQVERAIVVAPRGDTLGVLTELSFMHEGKTPGAIEVRFVSPDGSALPPPVGRIRLHAQSLPLEAFLAVPGASIEPRVAAEAPPGRYELEFEGSGRRTVARVPIEVRSGEITQATIVLEENVPVVAPVP